MEWNLIDDIHNAGCPDSINNEVQMKCVTRLDHRTPFADSHS